MDQNTQFIITVGTVIGVFLWLKNDINQLNGRIDNLNMRIDNLSTRMDKLKDEVAALRESIAWMRGRMGFTEPQPPSEN
ncbi:MAG: hypothetical protein F4063_07600 [Chloroflexi bacterium]|nr:hypothetical protein [Chloroflexota bacterium]MYI41772.1 hypothetical protein [Chloroflexota bacterium]